MNIISETFTRNGFQREMVMTPAEFAERYAKPGTCGQCKWWTAAHDGYVSTCHNAEAGLGAHLQSGMDSTCKFHEAK